MPFTLSWFKQKPVVKRKGEGKENKTAKEGKRKVKSLLAEKREALEISILEGVVFVLPEIHVSSETTARSETPPLTEPETETWQSQMNHLTSEGLSDAETHSTRPKSFTCRRRHYCRCDLWEAPYFKPNDNPSGAPMVKINAGHFVGRLFIPSGSLLFHISNPQRHLHVIAPIDDPREQRSAANRTPTRTAVRKSKRATDVQRPLSGMSQSASSPLNRSPIRRIVDSHDVITPDGFFEPRSQMSSTDVSLFTDEPEPGTSTSQDLQDSYRMEDYQKQIFELESELELLKTETEMQRREREKYQRLYETTALCQICMERRRNSFILPCSHFVYCGECLEHHWKENCRKCPMCRGPAHSVIITNLV